VGGVSVPTDARLELAQARVLPTPGRRRPGLRRGRGGLGFGLGVVAATIAAWVFVLQREGDVPGAGEIVERAARFAGKLLGTGAAGPPAYAEAASWWVAGGLVLDTVVMSVLAAGLAGAAALATIGFAARSLTVGEFGTGRWLGGPVYLLVRGLHVLARSVPELVWALLIVFLVPPGVVAGALALALHDLGVMGRLGADIIDDLGRAPLRALRATGAGRLALLAYGVLPQALPQLVTFLLYRWEVIIRASVVVGFITGAGLGYQLRLDLSFRDWTDLALVLLCYVLLVWAVDAVSAVLRRLAR
jgi:phosphonate transport system permease protein